jgi:hypothetical protein
VAATVGSRPDRLDSDHKLTALVTSATKDLSALVRDEVALAKAELRRDMKQAVMGSGLFAVAGVLAVFALIMLSFAAACGGVGLLRLKGIRGVDATKRSANESLAVLKRAGR